MELYKAIIPGQLETFATANNNNVRISIKALAVKVTDKKIKEFEAKADKVIGKFIERQRPAPSLRSGSKRDLSSEYARLKYTDKKIKEFEAKIDCDNFALGIREAILSGNMTKKQGIDQLLISKKYDMKTVMFISLHYYAFVYERTQTLKNEGKL